MSKIHLPKIIILLGATASGKTALSFEVARNFNGEIINADSRNVYKGMYVGTASPFAPKARARIKNYDFKIKGIKHHLFHFIEPWENYSVGQYKIDAFKAIKDILSRGKTPILVGGTGLYIWTVVDNLEIPKIPPQARLRRLLELTVKRKGVEVLWKKLIKLDPEAAKFVEKSNPRRIIRALEVMLVSGKKFSFLRQKGKPLFDALQIGTKIPREELYKRINTRVDSQINQGLVHETKKIYSHIRKNMRIKSDKVWQLPSLTSLGYRQIGIYLRGEVSPEEAIDLLKRDTRRYARRQMTWFRRDPRIKWQNNRTQVKQTIKKFLK